MNISAEEKNRYLREAEVVLTREGFLTDRTHVDRLRVLFDGLPLCDVPESGGITAYLSAWMRMARPDTRTCGVQPVKEKAFARPRRAATHGTAFTSQAAVKHSMSSSRPLT